MKCDHIMRKALDFEEKGQKKTEIHLKKQMEQETINDGFNNICFVNKIRLLQSINLPFC